MEHQLLQLGSEALRAAALNEKAKEYILNNDLLYAIMKKAAQRYIGGETLKETIPKVQEQNINGFKCSIEFMGESTRTEAEANEATLEFVEICEKIKLHNLHSTIALDLSHIGLAVSRDLAWQNLNTICEVAKRANIEVAISAEGFERTDDVIDTYLKASNAHDNLAITMQAYLYRSQDDFKELIKEKGRIKVVKGAFQVPEGHFIPRGSKLDEVYLDYVEQLFIQKHMCSIATHHDNIQNEVKALIKKHNPANDLYEFESLFGIQNENLAALKTEGYPTKIYFVYGKEWYLYLCNRIAEYPLNLFRALHDILEPAK